MIHTPRRMLLTGGAGFIGANFVRYLLDTDPDVHIVDLDLLTYAGRMENLAGVDPARHTFVHGDICDAALVSRLLREHQVDTILHFAAESHVDRSISGPGAFVRTNVEGTYVLLEAARQVWLGGAVDGAACRFHHISTDEVYGALGSDDAPFTEAAAYAPNSPYSASKAAADHLVRAYSHTYGLPVVTTASSNNYGPYQHQEKLIPKAITHCLAGKPIPIYGSGRNMRDWIHVEDHCRGIDLVLRQGRLGETYNIGACNEWRNIDLVERICALLDERRPKGAPHSRLISYVEDRPGHDWRYAVDVGKVRELGWAPQESFESGLAKTVEWYLKD